MLGNEIGMGTEPIAGALDLNDDCMMQKPVEQCGGDDRVPEGYCQLVLMRANSARAASFRRSFQGVSGPQVMGIGSGVAIGCGGEAIAAGPEDRVYLVMRGEEPLCLPW